MWRKVLKSPLQEAEFEGPKNTENLVKHNSSFLIEHFLNSTTIREGFKKKIVEFSTKGPPPPQPLLEKNFIS